MDAFKCDLCGKYYDSTTTNDIEIKKDIIVAFKVYKKRNGIATVSDICKSCNDIFEEYIKTAYKEICENMEEENEETENNNSTGDN